MLRTIMKKLTKVSVIREGRKERNGKGSTHEWRKERGGRGRGVERLKGRNFFLRKAGRK